MNVLNVFLLSLVTSVFSQGTEISYIKSLRKKLLNEYDVHAFPSKDLRAEFVINVTFYINKITNLDVRTGILTMDLYFPMKWRDDHLTWDPSNYGGLSRVPFGFNELWRPKVHIWNKVNVDPNYQFIPRDYSVNYTGQVTWEPQMPLSMRCYGDLKEYPFDTQRCYLYMVLNLEAMNFVLRAHVPERYNNSRGIAVFGPYDRNPEWSLTNITLEQRKGMNRMQNYTYLYLAMSLQRNTHVYTYYILFPYITASLLTAAMFWLEIGSSKRTIFCGISLVILVVLLIFIGNEIGFHSSDTAPYAVKCISINLMLTGVSMILPLLLFRLFASFTIECPRFIVAILQNNHFEKIFLLHFTTKEAKNKQNLEKNIESMVDEALSFTVSTGFNENWMLFVAFLDRICFFVYVIAFICFHS